MPACKSNPDVSKALRLADEMTQENKDGSVTRRDIVITYFKPENNADERFYPASVVEKVVRKIKNDKGSHKCERILKTFGL